MSEEHIAEDFEIMSSQEVGVRTLVLFAIWMLSCTETPRNEVIQWIKSNNLWDSLSPNELTFVEANPATKKQLINFSWHTERLHVLSWALGIITKLASAYEQSDINALEKTLSLVNYNAKPFLKTVQLRDETEIIEASDEIEKHHWEARNSKIHDCQPKKPVDIEVIQERHHAINWILWGREEEWDDVATDT